MERAFKDINPGIFKAKNGLCYIKFEKEVPYDDENQANAVVITSGQFKYFEPDNLVEDLQNP